MSMLRLSLGEMIYVIEYLLENKEARQIMDKNPMLAILIPHLRQARDLLANTRDTPQIILSPGQEMAIRQNLRKYDDEHDQANRIFEGLLALASRSTNDENVRAKADGAKASNALVQRTFSLASELLTSGHPAVVEMGHCLLAGLARGHARPVLISKSC